MLKHRIVCAREFKETDAGGFVFKLPCVALFAKDGDTGRNDRDAFDCDIGFFYPLPPKAPECMHIHDKRCAESLIGKDKIATINAGGVEARKKAVAR